MPNIPVKSQDRKRSFHSLSHNIAIFSRNWVDIASGLFIGILMLYGAIAIVFFDENGEITLSAVIITIACFLASFGLFGVWFAVFSWRRKHMVADRGEDILCYKAFIKGLIKGKPICKLSDIAAVQICSVLGSFNSGQSVKEVTVFETNVILKNPDDKRINMTIGRNADQIRGDVAQFAEFLGVPLLDHS